MLDSYVAKLIKSLSVFLPTYNEEATIKKVVLKTKKVVEEVAGEWEIIIVNDGSSDTTGDIALELHKEDRRIRVITHQKNEGYGASLESGFYSGKFPWIAFIDSDGQFDFSEITSFIQKQKETNADLVIGYYKKRKVSPLKIVTSRIWEGAIFILFGLRVKDVDCGFKLISKRVIDTIPHLESKRGAFISSELLIKSRKFGFKIVEIPVTHYPRLQGVGTGRNLNVILRSFIDLFKLWKKLH